MESLGSLLIRCSPHILFLSLYLGLCFFRLDSIGPFLLFLLDLPFFELAFKNSNIEIAHYIVSSSSETARVSGKVNWPLYPAGQSLPNCVPIVLETCFSNDVWPC